jgi:hypothetical protein
MALDLLDDETWDALSRRHVQLTRETGALTMLPLVLTLRLLVHVLAGELTAAAALSEEVEAVAEATGTHLGPYGPLLLAVWRGRQSEVTALIEASEEAAATRGEGIALTIAGWMSGVLHNGLGRYEAALAAARPASEHPPELHAPSVFALVEVIEPAVRTGQPEVAADALRRLSTATSASGTDWALGIQARCRALVSHGQDAETAYREAIERLGRTRIRTDLARAHLLYGE